MHYERKCLLIDDDPDDHEIFRFALEGLNDPPECHYAYDGDQALELLQNISSFTPLFIFLDVNMPKMTGKQCLLEMKKIERLKIVPVYMYSTSKDEGLKEECIILGAHGFVVKPNKISLLTNIIDEVLLNSKTYVDDRATSL